MPWLKRHVGKASFLAEQKLFEAAFMGAGAPRGMLLAASSSAEGITLYALIPASMQTLFPGFEPSEEPIEIKVGLVGHQDEINEALRGGQ